jgi:predicted ATPase/DNA-binding XRE family transcriptional regulator
VPDQPSLSFAGLLRQLRAAAGLTQEELAEAARLSPRSISDLERGINRTARRETALLLAGALGLSGSRKQLFVASARGQAAPAVPNNLPAELTPFVGRDRERSEVRALAELSRLVTLTGPGGCGKTRLGLRVAAGLLDRAGDGVWVAELAPVTDENAVAAAVAGALRIPLAPGRAALDTLADALAPQDILIVLDNCEHVLGGCVKTADALLRRCPKLRLIATSREPLGMDGEAIYRVPSLSLPAADADSAAAALSSDAVALLAARARAHGVSLAMDAGNVPLVVSVCRRLDGMPLAIELAAARLRSMSLPDLAGRLDQRFRLLTGGSRTAVPRQQTLRAAIGWSYSLLTASERVVLGRLSVFAGGFGLAAAEAVCGFGAIDVPGVADLLGSLVDKSLVSTELAGPGLRYRMLETIRLFAAECLADAGDQETAAVLDAHCSHYLAVAEAAAARLSGPDQGRWLALLDTDRADMRRAARHAAAEPGGTPLVLRFGAALWRYWFVRHDSQEAAGLLIPVLARPDAAADPGLFAEALFAAAVNTAHSDLPTSLRLAEQADDVACSAGDDRLLILSRAMLAFAHTNSGDIDQARRWGQESVERARELGDDVLLGITLAIYAGVAGAPAFGPLYAEAIACTERSGDHFANMVLHDLAGIDALEIGDIPGAKAHLETAAQTAETLGDPRVTATAHLALVRLAEHDRDGARSAFEDVLRESRRIGNKSLMAESMLGLACLAADLADWRRAALLHGAAQFLQDQTGNPWQRFDARRRQESLDQIAAALDAEQVDRAYARGTALSLDQATDLALEAQEPG